VLEHEDDRAPEVVEQRRGGDQQVSTQALRHSNRFSGMNQKLDTGRVFERIFDIYRDQFTLLIPAALMLFLPVAIISGLVYAGDAGILGALLLTAVGALATFWFQGAVVEAARDILDGRRDHTIASLFRSVVPVLAPLIIAGLFVSLATLVGFALLLVPGLIVLTFFALTAPVIVVERLGVVDSLRRSIELVRGNAWQVFGVIVVLFLLEFIANLVLRALANSADSFVLYAVAALVVSLLVAPLRALAAAVMFFEVKAMHGEPVLGTDAQGRVTQSAEPAGGPAPTPAEPPAAAPAPPSGPEAPAPPAGPTTGTEEGGTDRQG
jgi:hypothetical protein